jgi:hypothetical protein
MINNRYKWNNPNLRRRPFHPPRTHTRTRRIQHPRLIIDPQILTPLQLRVHHLLTIVRKFVDAPNHAPNTDSRSEEIPDVELVEGCAPRDDERVVYLRRGTRHDEQEIKIENDGYAGERTVKLGTTSDIEKDDSAGHNVCLD